MKNRHKTTWHTHSICVLMMAAVLTHATIAISGGEDVHCAFRENDARDLSRVEALEPGHPDQPCWCADVPGYQNTDQSCLLSSILTRDAEQCISRDLVDYDEELEGYFCLVLDSDAELCPDSGPYNMTVYLSKSGVTFDGLGNTFETHYKNTSTVDAIQAPYHRSVSDITIRNLNTVQKGNGYGSAISLRRYFRAEDENCLFHEFNLFDYESRFDLYADSEPSCAEALLGHHDILIENITARSAKSSGIYIGQNSRDIHVRNVEISETRTGPGIYLEAGTMYSLIEYAYIWGNKGREAIAVDAAKHNTIRSSTFKSNLCATGHDVCRKKPIFTGIAMYKNGGEKFGRVCPVSREYGANFNTIRNNTFINDDIRIGARDGDSCKDSLLDCDDMGSHYLDEANGNRITQNTFKKGSKIYFKSGSMTAMYNIFEDGAGMEIGTGLNNYWMTGYILWNTFKGEMNNKYFDSRDGLNVSFNIIHDKSLPSSQYWLCWAGIDCSGVVN